MIILAADTTFREADPVASVLGRLEKTASFGWDDLLQEHVEDYKNLYDRVKLEIEGQEKVVRFFQFGRYLLI